MKKITSILVSFAFMANSIIPVASAQTFGDGLVLPVPGAMVSVSPDFSPALIKGLTVHQDNPFLFDFIVDPGQSKLSQGALKEESDRMIKYFFAALTVPDKDVWVNLSPYEKDRMVPQALGQTAMGRDLLAQDYLLKQLTASLIYPQKDLGKTFWNTVYAKAKEMYGTTQIPVNTFNKVWIVPQRIGVYEHAQTAYIVDSHLKVMLEEDYLATTKHNAITDPSAVSKPNTNQLGSQIIRQIVLPAIEKEVNEGKNFATLRQIVYAQALAVWFKHNLRQALLNQVYANKGTVKGIDQNTGATNEAIYQKYLKAYKKGVFNYIKEDVDPITQETLPRKYFSGGYDGEKVSQAMVAVKLSSEDAASLADGTNGIDVTTLVETNRAEADKLVQKEELLDAAGWTWDETIDAAMIQSKEQVKKELQAVDVMLDFLTNLPVLLFREMHNFGIFERITLIPEHLPHYELGSEQQELRNKQLGILIYYKDEFSKEENQVDAWRIRDIVSQLEKEFGNIAHSHSFGGGDETLYVQFTQEAAKKFETEGEPLDPEYEILQRRLIDRLISMRNNLATYGKDRFGLTNTKRKPIAPPAGLITATKFISINEADVRFLETQINGELKERGEKGNIHLGFNPKQKGYRKPMQGEFTYVLGGQLNVLEFIEDVENFMLGINFSEQRAKQIFGHFGERYNQVPRILVSSNQSKTEISSEVENFLKGLAYSYKGTKFNLSGLSFNLNGWGDGTQTDSKKHKFSLSLSVRDHWAQTLTESVERVFSSDRGILENWGSNFKNKFNQKKWAGIKRKAIAADEADAAMRSRGTFDDRSAIEREQDARAWRDASASQREEAARRRRDKSTSERETSTIYDDLRDSKQGEKNKDRAALTNKPQVEGGIDLSEQDAAMRVTKDANGGVRVNIDPALIVQVEREGLSDVIPVIINMKPADMTVLTH